MKKILLASVFVACLLSCSKQEDVASNNVTIYATVNNEDNTKVSFDGASNSLNTVWSSGEIMKTLTNPAASTTYDFTLATGAGTTNATFTGTAPYTTSDDVYAFCGKSLKHNTSGYLYYEIPYQQSYVENNVENGILMTYAKGKINNLVFNHGCSILRIKLYSSTPKTIRSIVFINDTYVTGYPSVNYNFVHMGDGWSDNRFSVKLNIPEGVTLGSTEGTATEFNFVIDGKARTLENLKFTIEDNDGHLMILKKTSDLPVVAGKVYSFATKEYDPSSILYVSIDGAVETIWDGSALPTPTSSIKVRSKDADSYLTDILIDKIKTALSSCTNAVDVDLSGANYPNENFTSWAYSPCLKNIKTFKFPQGVKNIPNNCFYSYSKIEEVYIPSSVMKIGDYGYGTIFDEGAYGRKFIVDGGNTVYSSNSSGWLLDKAGTKVVKIALDNRISSIIVPEGITSLGPQCITVSTITSITLPSTIGTIDAQAFVNTNNLQTITCKATVAPSLGVQDWGGGSNPGRLVPAANRIIYIPTGSSTLDSYQNADGGWKKYMVDKYGYSFTQTSFPGILSASITPLQVDNTSETIW